MQSGEESIDELYALNAAGARFLRPEIERAYLAWRFERGASQTMMYVVVSMIFWTTAATLMLALGLSTAALWSVGVMSPALASLFVAVRRRSPEWTTRAWLLTAAVSGLVGVGLGIFLSVELHPAVLAGIVLACFWHLSTSTERPLHTALAVAVYMAAQTAAIGSSAARGSMAINAFLFETWILVVSYGMAVATAVLAERRRRRDYRLERTIELQKETIARERARSEGVLRRELSHQVAERSRELGAALAKGDLSIDAARLRPGDRFAERYRVVELLGAGGMGSVYEVERMTDGQRLALKAISGGASGAGAGRFAREAEIGARVQHPNLVSIVDVGASSGVPFLVMDLVRGGSLEDQRSRFGDVAWALPLLRQVALGLGALHDASVVHRDLKPANVLLDNGVARISDFGISRFGALEIESSIDPTAATVETPGPARPALTGTGMILGTPLYMAPEAAKSARSIDASADVFALGILGYELLTGRGPFTTPPFLLALAGQPVPAPSTLDDVPLPPALRALILSCLSSEPTRRPSVHSIVAALEELAPRSAAASA